ncbi:MAG: DUF1801 domain-containing protein [Pseudomonadota bacterium]
MARPTFESHDQYIKSAPVEVQPILTRIQSIVESKVPDATRHIGYGMPAFKRGKVFFYFAPFKKHIGIYPPLTTNAALIKALEPYRGPKGNLTFPLNEPMPYELIGRVAAALAKQYAAK